MSAKPRILLLGGSGQLGHELHHMFVGRGEVVAPSRSRADLANPQSIRAIIRGSKPDVVLNAAAYTAVDRAESESELAMAINGTAPRVMAEEAARSNAILVHYSTDYVFNGAKSGAWTEDDAPDPLNTYGRTKREGEKGIEETGGAYLIFRTSWVYSARGYNFLLTMLRLGATRQTIDVVDDQFGAPTSARSVAAATRNILNGIFDGRYGSQSEWAGLYHMTCSGKTSWFGFARAIFAQQSRPGAKAPAIHPIPTAQYPTPARRPANSVLSNEKLLARFGVQLDSWEAAMKPVMQELAAFEIQPA
ncbi:MAG TPA: dTDP-4-dehydrorhamnose reductase [Terracidiphilus sp.]|nr:dTDP-4-dehydrorhamnose reductase [Terracidiphilus sp.]